MHNDDKTILRIYDNYNFASVCQGQSQRTGVKTCGPLVPVAAVVVATMRGEVGVAVEWGGVVEEAPGEDGAGQGLTPRALQVGTVSL